MSGIVEAIDVEIQEAEAQLEQLRGLREHALQVNGAGPARPPPLDSEKSAPAKRGAGRSKGHKPVKQATEKAEAASNPRRQKVLSFVEGHPGCARREIEQGTSLRINQVTYDLQVLGAEGKVERRGETAGAREGKVERRGETAGARYFPAGADAPRPSEAPEPVAPAPSSTKAAAAYERQKRISQAILELVADSEPITGEEITTILLEQIPDAERNNVVMARANLKGQGKIDERADGFHMPTSSKPPGPITDVERRCVTALQNIPLTASEVGLNMTPQMQPAKAREILEGLCRRGVIDKYQGNGSAVYETKETVAA